MEEVEEASAIRTAEEFCLRRGTSERVEPPCPAQPESSTNKTARTSPQILPNDRAGLQPVCILMLNVILLGINQPTAPVRRRTVPKVESCAITNF